MRPARKSAAVQMELMRFVEGTYIASICCMCPVVREHPSAESCSAALLDRHLDRTGAGGLVRISWSGPLAERKCAGRPALDARKSLNVTLFGDIVVLLSPIR